MSASTTNSQTVNCKSKVQYWAHNAEQNKR